MTTNRPALETAAAVSSPEIAEAIVSPESTSMMMNRTMMPSGVRIMPMMVPEPDPLPIFQDLPSHRLGRKGLYLLITWEIQMEPLMPEL